MTVLPHRQCEGGIVGQHHPEGAVPRVVGLEYSMVILLRQVVDQHDLLDGIVVVIGHAQ